MISRSTDIKSALRSRQRGFLLNPYRFGAGGLGDPYYSDVSLLLHADGTNGSTTFTDNSPSPKTVTAYGNAQISTAQSKWGVASAYLDGAGDYLNVADSAGFDFGVGDFTVELWLYQVATGAIRQVVGQHKTTGGASDNSFLVLSDASTIKLQVYSGTTTFSCDSPSAHSLNAWHHVACVRDDTTLRLFVDGTQVATASVGSSAINNSTQPVSIGAVMSSPGTPDPGGYYLNGYIDDLRITKGVARYTADFTPPTAAFPNS